MNIVASKYSKISETKNGRFSLRLSAEVGKDEFVAAHMRANNGAIPSREEQDKHVRWQTLFVFADERDVLERLLNRLQTGEKKSLLARLTRRAMEFEGVFTDKETGEIRTARNISTGVKYLSIWDEESRVFVPAPAFFR